MPADSYPFPMYSGLLEPEHYKRIGNAIWLFMWLVSSTTSEQQEDDGTVWGVVKGGAPVKLDSLSEQFGVTRKTIGRWIDELEENGYVRIIRAPYGLIFSVHNSKKFKNRVDKNVLSESTDETKMSYHPDRDETFLSKRRDIPVPSNKDITKINNAVTITDPDQIIRRAKEIETYFCQKRGQGLNVSLTDFNELKKMVATGIPLEIVKRSIDKSFADYSPKHAWDKIRNVSYCIPRCLDEWARMQVDESITDGALPNRPVALGTSPQRQPSRKQQELDDLRRRMEEERRREENRSAGVAP